ncbi:MAG: hypothetical protein RLZ12_718 [Bacillota bacterium]
MITMLLFSSFILCSVGSLFAVDKQTLPGLPVKKHPFRLNRSDSFSDFNRSFPELKKVVTPPAVLGSSPSLSELSLPELTPRASFKKSELLMISTTPKSIASSTESSPFLSEGASIAETPTSLSNTSLASKVPADHNLHPVTFLSLFDGS